MANLLAPGVKYFCLYDNVNNNAYVIDGNDIDPGSTLEKEDLTRGTNARGGVKHLNEDWSLELNFGDQSMYSTLLALARNRNYRFTVIKLNGFVFWEENQRFSLNESSLFDPSSEDYPFVLNMSHISNAPDISQKLNAMAPWKDSDGDGTPDGYTYTATSGSFLNGIFSDNLGSDGSGELYKELVIPIEGLTLELAVSFDQLHNDGDHEFGVEYYNSSGSLISSDLTAVSSTGRKTKTLTLPANVYTVRVIPIKVTNVTQSIEEFNISQPSLKIMGTDYQNY